MGCTIRVQDLKWTPAIPAIVSGKIENLSGGSLEEQLQPILYLSCKTPSAERDKYWAPVDLFGDRPLLTDERPLDQKGEVVAIKPIPVKLTFKKAEAVEFSFRCRHILWDGEISSNWPSGEQLVLERKAVRASLPG